MSFERPPVVADAFGDRWQVYEWVGTAHGFDVVLGRPERRAASGPDRRGGNRVVLTPELAAYLGSVRHRRGACDLPVAGTTVKRLRRLLGYGIYDDMREWWESHADEIADSTYEDFAARHGRTLHRVGQVARAMFGKRLREPGWWRLEPARSAILADDLPVSRIAEDLGIAAGSVRRLRWVLQHE